MSEQPTTSVLRRMLAQDEPVAADVPLTVARSMRLSGARAAENCVGLKLTVLGVSEEVLSLDLLLGRLSDDLLLMQMHCNGAAIGLAAMDTGLVAAIVESQTMGKLDDKAPSGRPMTTVDASLAEPFVSGLLAEMAKTIAGTDLESWIDGVIQKNQFSDLRQIGLTLPQASYRLLRMAMDFGVAERGGVFYLALPMAQKAEPKPQPRQEKPNWSKEFPETVGASNAALPVILHRFDMPLAQLESIEVGQVVSLPLSRVDSTRLEMDDGTLIGKGKLGQKGGYLALRLQSPAEDVLQELGGEAAVSAPAFPAMDVEEPAGVLPDIDMALPDVAEDLLDMGDLSTLENSEDPSGLGDLGAMGGPDQAMPDVDLGTMDLGDLGGGDNDPMAGIELPDTSDDQEGEIDLSSIDLGSLGT